MYVSLPIDIQLPSPADIFAFVVIIDPFLDTFWTPSAHLQSHFKACTCASKRHPVAKSFEHHRTVFNHWPRGLHIAPTIQARTCTHQFLNASYTFRRSPSSYHKQRERAQRLCCAHWASTVGLVSCSCRPTSFQTSSERVIIQMSTQRSSFCFSPVRYGSRCSRTALLQFHHHSYCTL